MEKSDFIVKAPAYYALGIAIYFLRNNNEAFVENISSHFDYFSHQIDEVISFMHERALLEAGLKYLAERSMIVVSPDDFGPTLYSPADDFYERWQDLIDDRVQPFYNYSKLKDKQEDWVRGALSRVNSDFQTLSILAEDFSDPDADWAPIPLDRGDANVKIVIGKMESTVDLVTQDNGYAAHFPEERIFVKESLSDVTERLKMDAGVSIQYLRKRAFEPLYLLISRFSDAAIGIAAKATASALFDVIKGHVSQVVQAALKSWLGL